jgi:PAS domain S-box-containing protein
MSYLHADGDDRELLLAAFEQIPTGVALIDRNFRYVAINEALAAANQLPADAHIGKTVEEVLPGAWPMLGPLLTRVLNGETLTETWHQAWRDRYDHIEAANAVFVPVRAGQVDPESGQPPVAGIAVLFTVMTEQALQSERDDRIVELRSTLFHTHTVEAATAAMYALCETELACSMLMLGSTDPSTNTTRTVLTRSADLHDARVLVTDQSDLSRLPNTPRKSQFLDLETLDAVRALGITNDDVADLATVSLVATPHGETGRTLLAVGWSKPRHLVGEEREWLERLADIADFAIERLDAQARDDAAAVRAKALLNVAAALNTMVDAEEIARKTADTMVVLSDALEAGIYLLSENGNLRRVGVRGAMSLERRERFVEVPKDAELPVVEVLHGHTTMWLEKGSDWDAFPAMKKELEPAGWPPTAVLPLTVAGTTPGGAPSTPFGSVYVTFPPGHRISDAERRFVETVTELGAAALSRLQFSEAEARTRAELLSSQDRMASLVESGAVGIVEATSTHIVRANEAFLQMLGYNELPDGGLDWKAITPQEWRDVDERAMQELYVGRSCRPFEKEYYRADGSRVPVMVTIGVYRHDPFQAVATIIDVSERKEAERRELSALEARERLTRAVQTALFPRLMIQDSPYDVEVGYRPGDDRLALGGDFYDAITIEGDRLAVIVGDVAGHGPSAAATGAALRAAWRSNMLTGRALAEVPGILERVLVSERDADSHFATTLMALLDRHGQVELVASGHPAPLLIRSGKAFEIDVIPELLLGVVPVAEAKVTRFRLQPNDQVLLFTDGLIEGLASPESSERLGVDGLRHLIEASDTLPTPERIIDAAVSRHGAGLPDDVAVMLIQPHSMAAGTVVSHTSDTISVLDMELSDRGGSVSAARRRVADALAGRESAMPVVLVVSELATNALRHAQGPQRLVVERFGTRIRVTVSDGSTTKPTLGPPLHENIGDGGRGLRMVQQVATDWGVTVEDEGKTVWADLPA